MWQLLGVAFTVGALTVFFDLSSASFFVALVHRSQYVDANSKMGTTRSLSYIAGPSTAGLLVQALTAPVAIAADALSFVVSALALRGVKVREPQVELNGTSARADLQEGFRYLARQPVLRAGVACTSTINFFSFFVFAIFVLYASRTLGLSAGVIGLILGAASFGALAGALIAPRVGRRLGIGRAVVVGSVLFPAPMALFPLAHGSHWLSGAMLLAGEFLASVGVMIFDVNQNSLMLMLIPHEVRSRVVGVSQVLQLRNEALRSTARRRARIGDRVAADSVGRCRWAAWSASSSSWPRRCRRCGRRISHERLERPQERPLCGPSWPRR